MDFQLKEVPVAELKFTRLPIAANPLRDSVRIAVSQPELVLTTADLCHHFVPGTKCILDISHSNADEDISLVSHTSLLSSLKLRSISTHHTQSTCILLMVYTVKINVWSSHKHVCGFVENYFTHEMHVPLTQSALCVSVTRLFCVSLPPWCVSLP